MRNPSILLAVVIGVCVGLFFAGDSASRLAPDEAARVWFDVLARRDFSEAEKISLGPAQKAALTKQFYDREGAQLVKALEPHGAALPSEKRRELSNAWAALLQRASVRAEVVAEDELEATVRVTVSRIDARALQGDFFQRLKARRAALRAAGAPAKQAVALTYADALLETLDAAQPLAETASFEAICQKRIDGVRGAPEGLDLWLVRLRLAGHWELANSAAFTRDLRKALLQYD